MIINNIKIGETMADKEEFFSVGDKIIFNTNSAEDEQTQTSLCGKIKEMHIEPNGNRWLKVEGVSDEYDTVEAINGWYNSANMTYVKFLKR